MATSGEESKEAVILRRNFDALGQTIVSPLSTASLLYSKGLIDRKTRDDAGLMAVSNHDRSFGLVRAIESLVKYQPDKFEVFLDALEDQEVAYGLVKKIREQLKSAKEENTVPPATTKPPADPPTNVIKRVTGRTMDKDPDDISTEVGSPPEDDVVDNEKINPYSYWPVVRGVGGVIVVSLMMWAVMMFFYQTPVVDESFSPIGVIRNRPTGQPNSECHRIDKPVTVFEELQNSVSEVKVFAAHLGLPLVKMDMIDRENKSVREKLLKVVQECYEMDICPCWENIVEALVKCGKVVKSHEIKEKYINDDDYIIVKDE